MNKVVAIPRELSKTGELVIISRSDYEEFLRLKKIIPLVEPTLSEKKQFNPEEKKSEKENILL